MGNKLGVVVGEEVSNQREKIMQISKKLTTWSSTKHRTESRLRDPNSSGNYSFVLNVPPSNVIAI